MRSGKTLQVANPRNLPEQPQSVPSEESSLEAGRSQDPLGLLQLDRIYLEDCLVGMKRVPDQSVDLVIADPPYNASKGNTWKWDQSADLPGFGGKWSKVMATWDNMSLADYLEFTVCWLSEVKRVLRPTGSIWIHGTYHNIGIVNFALQMLDIEIINEVVWFKRNSFPNLSGRRLTASHETILWAHTGKKRTYLFNYEAAKTMACTGDSLKLPGRQMRTVWDIPNNKDPEELRYGKHPTQKPVRLLKRMIELSAEPGGICLVPFSGSGSECMAARACGLRFIGFETDPTYFKISNARLGTGRGDHLIASSHPCADRETLKVTQQIPMQPPEKMASHPIPSLIKWTGSKRSQVETIVSFIPTHNRYFEPFLGSGAVLYRMARPSSEVGDVYGPLIDLWNLVQSNPETLIENYTQQWYALQDSLPLYFYKVRKRFNTTPNAFDLNFLARTCVNGIIRFNSDGKFNNSFHLSRPGMNPGHYASIVKLWHIALRGVSIRCADYEETLSDAKAGDFAYLDPPYLGNRQRYTQSLDFDRFISVLEGLNRRGVKWALSFDGRRGDILLDSRALPDRLYKRRMLIASGNSAVRKVLGGSVEAVQESLYVNYE